MVGVHLMNVPEDVGVAHHVCLYITNMSHDSNALGILQNERTWQTLGKTNEVSESAKPIIRMVRYPTSVCIMLIIRKYKGVLHSTEAYDVRTTKCNRLNQTSMHHK